MEQNRKALLEQVLFGSDGLDLDLMVTDPEYTTFFSNFAFGEVLDEFSLPEPEALLAILASLVGCQGFDVFQRIVEAVSFGPLSGVGLRPVQIREMIYQATAYLGVGRVLPFLKAFDHAVQEAKIRLPIVKSGTVTPETREAEGSRAQVEIFGDGMKGYGQSGPEESRHIRRWLVDNCFGDYYTRKGLSLREREMVTFCFLMAQGGCEPQLTAHAQGNMNVGNDRDYLISILSICIPFIGYPRALNALNCVETAAASAAKAVEKN